MGSNLHVNSYLQFHSHFPPELICINKSSKLISVSISHEIVNENLEVKALGLDYWS
jgi:hypothetical protein